MKNNILHCTVSSKTQITYKHTHNLTRDVGGDLGEGRLTEALGGSSADRHQVGGSWMQAREHVVGFVPQLGYSSAGTGHVNARVRRLNALVADLGKQGTMTTGLK